MDTIFTLQDDTDETKINLDDLYERKKEMDFNNMQVFNRILKRIHTKIKTTSRMKPGEAPWRNMITSLRRWKTGTPRN